jgi:hypothetical protein
MDIAYRIERICRCLFVRFFVRRFIEQQNSHSLLIAVTFSATISICGESSTGASWMCEATHQSCRLIHKIVEIPRSAKSSMPYIQIKETKEEKAFTQISLQGSTESKSMSAT